MKKCELQRRTGTAALPDLWHFGEGGTMGARNLGSNLFDIAEQLHGPDGCEVCGCPTQGLARCDECMDAPTVPVNDDPGYVEGGNYGQ